MFFVIISQFVLVIAAGQQPHVKTDLGSIYGFQIDTIEGDKADIFLGIPYTEPPIGNLRFEKPVPVKPWKQPLNATTWSNECVPHTRKAKVFTVGEDCLTLNVIRPSKQPPPEGFPVLLWIHGGGFEIGSARLYGYESFTNAYTHRDVIVVTVQYRIGVFGFLSTGNNDLPGNLGLWDLTESLKFVNKHIGAFGGNPNKVTLWGLSAGGAAVGQLVLSPHSRDYSVAAVEMSGSPWASWAIGHHVVNSSTALLEALGCANEPKVCIKSKSVDEINEAVEKIGYTTDDLRIIRWGPRMDGDFFPADLGILAKEAPKKPLITGVSNKDAAFFTLMARSKFIHNVDVKSDLRKFGEKEMTDIMQKQLESSAEFGENQELAIKKILEFYLKGKEEGGDSFYLNKYTDFIGDLIFNVPAIEGAIARRDAGWPVYLYSFDHYNNGIWEPFNVPEGARGSVHINEFPFMFDKNFLPPFEYNEADLKIRENIRQCLADFAKTGIATWNEIEWNAIGENLEYIVIKEEPEKKINFYKESMEFWRSQQSYGYDVIEMKKTSIPQTHTEL